MKLNNERNESLFASKNSSRNNLSNENPRINDLDSDRVQTPEQSYSRMPSQSFQNI